MIKKTFGFRKTILTTLIMLFFSGSVWALKPEVTSSKRVILRIEHPHDGLRVCYAAVVNGAEMWWWRYYKHIVTYCTKNSPPFYATLPGYGYTLVDAAKLARMLTLDPELAPRGFTATLRDRLVTAMQNDRRYGAQKQVGDYWDPLNYWKWRSVYMENRISQSYFNGNCFGTADYMTKGMEWVRAYPETSVFWQSYFPFITLDGENRPGVCPYNLDHELKRPEFSFVDLHIRGSLVGYYLNCFDLLRYNRSGGDPYEYDLIITTSWNTKINLGIPNHAEVYLLSDRAAISYVFMKQGVAKGYKIDAQYYPVEFMCALFYHNHPNKEVITSIWKENWANVPVN